MLISIYERSRRRHVCEHGIVCFTAVLLSQWMEVVRVRALSALVRTVLTLLLTGANGRYRCNTYVHLLLRMHPRIYTRLRQAALDGRVLEVE